MYCPKCGTENPDNAQLCNVCGYVLENDATERPVAKPKTSRIAIASFVLGILSLIFFLFTAIPAIVLGIVGIFKIKKSAGQLKGKGLAITGIVIPVILVMSFILWSFDAAPIPNDYTIADLRSAPPEYAHTFELLMSISEKGEKHPQDAPLIGLSAQDVNTINQLSEVFKEGDYSKIIEALKVNAESINQAWENGKKGRDIIEELNTFPEIADLTEPDLEAKIGFLRNLKLLSYLYQAFLCIQTEQGNSQSAANELIKLDSVFRKLSINARPMVTKLVCIAGLYIGINTANFIINNPQTSQESLELLAEHFTPLTKEHIALRNSVISEYLMFKKVLDTQLAKLRKTSFLKFNSVSRLYKNFVDHRIAIEENRGEIEPLTVWPAIYPKLPVTIDSNCNFPWYYTAYNPIGSVIILILIPALDKVSEIKTRLEIHSDLLQIVLNKRLGKEISLRARAYGDEYIIDVENKKLFSPGPDGEPHTEDDIKLTINPEVLGLLPK